jgi:heterotetrameric sarcosine oxidase delta subunit
MQQFHCPFCGVREQSEFTYLREVASFPALDAHASVWHRYVYERANPCGAHAEWWQHQHGCRQILAIVRDTLSHEVLDIRLAQASQGQA